jgi:7-keto-8-aminopelargonate synthetase-like enzyme
LRDCPALLDEIFEKVHYESLRGVRLRWTTRQSHEFLEKKIASSAAADEAITDSDFFKNLPDKASQILEKGKLREFNWI